MAPRVTPLRDAWPLSLSSREGLILGSVNELLGKLSARKGLPGRRFPDALGPGASRAECGDWGFPDACPRLGSWGPLDSATRALGGHGTRSPTKARSKARGSVNEPIDG